MKIAIGSKNKTKILACERVFPEAEIIAMRAPSDVSEQPFSDEETLQGAKNRAKWCLEQEGISFGIGLEGGVMQMKDTLYLCNWGALATKDKIFVASGAKIPLPQEVAKRLEAGIELGDVMDDYAKRKNVRQNEGAIGIFTNGYISRTELFMHVVSMLRGQYEFLNR